MKNSDDHGVKEINGGRLLVNVWAGQKISARERRSGRKIERRDKVMKELEGVKGHPTAFWDLIVNKYFGGVDPMEKVTKWANTVATAKDNKDGAGKLVMCDTFEMILGDDNTDQEFHIDLRAPARNCVLCLTPHVNSTKVVRVCQGKTVSTLKELCDVLESEYDHKVSEGLKTVLLEMDGDSDEPSEGMCISRQHVKDYGNVFFVPWARMETSARKSR